jgi:hypothetical protein
MSTEPINYEAVIADLEAKKAQLDATINMLRALGGLGAIGSPTPTGGGSPNTGGNFASDAFFGKSIPDATVTILASQRRKMSTQSLMDTMVKGGLPPSKYNTVYAILRRRESQVGDLVNMQGEWGLAAWYPNHPKKGPKKAGTVAAGTAGQEANPDEAELTEESNVEEMKATA